MCLLAFFLLLFDTISLVSSRPNEAMDPLLIAGAFEGDILGIDSKQLNGIVNTEAFWEKSVVPFIVDSKLDFIRKRSIEKAMMRLQDQTCLRFIARQREENYLHFTDGTGCASHIGRVGGRQDVIVGAECDQVGLVLHLIMHALGFWHEESSDDSPDYVLINWENIKEQDKLHFQTYTHRKTNHMSEPFDYRSLMHMSPNAFAINRETPTILSKDERFVLGQRLSLSEGDVNKVVRRYCGRRVSDDDEDVAADDPADNDGRNLGANPIASRTPLALMGAPRSAKCSDSSYKCPLWATQGDCYKRAAVMRRECQESCRVCQNDQECTNYNSLCGVWAWMGRCTAGAGSSARQVLATCPLACAVCIPADAEETLLDREGDSCHDKLHTCRRLARKGRCFYKHILSLCPAACNACEQQTGSTRRRVQSSTSCQDTWSTLRCARWKRLGWCSRSRDRTTRNYCKKTCAVCTPQQGDFQECKDVNPLCSIVTRPDMCDSLIKLQCAKSCHVC